MSKINCHKEVKGYHTDEVNLANDEQGDMRDRRNNGRSRLKNGLNKADHPLPKYFSSQGSYAMRTMVQDSQCDYDIDDGVYFEKDDLIDSEHNSLSPKEARLRIKNALKDDRLKHPAVVKTNCVRQNYPEGYHIDLPVYRIIRSKDEKDNDVEDFELASGDDWVKSDARAVTRWFKEIIGNELKQGEVDTSQIRRVTKLTKKFSRSRIDWKKQTTSGICITRLVTDEMQEVNNRDDEALRETWQAISARLDISQKIAHPVLAGKNLAEENDEGVAFFHECLKFALSELEKHDKADCTKRQALDAWDKVFNTKYFSEHDDDGQKKASSPFVVTSEDVANRQDNGRRFG